ncbi:unnamed protein product [Hyaloperonospora brassicae]|uniref:HTH myb-type domain-containing protein n=1 Tax=Hyaloperonospora brassicae TaxID=162125 RepID=A0AAV0UIL9_HYABA|nr:unnamed protein product [Hyaloperonospora brassicae]
MTISRNVYNQLFEPAPDASSGGSGSTEKVIRLRPTEAKAGAVVMSAKSKIQMWTKDEHERFLAALEQFPAGPWKKVADYIGTKTPRQTMTHAQKYRQKIHRRQRGLRNQKKTSSEGRSARTGDSTPPLSSNNSNSSNSNNSSNSSSGSPPLLNTEAKVKGEPTDLIVSPYGVAELQLKPGSEAALAAAAGATNDQLLNILAQQATTIHDKPELVDADQAAAAAVPEAAAADDSSTTNLPSLAEILHLSGGEGQTAATVETEGALSASERDSEAKTAVKIEAEATEVEIEAPSVSEECKCNCKCSVHGGKKEAVNETAAQLRPEAM